MMKYREKVEQSAEYLRRALPLMTRQRAALHPVSYAVWYEYVAGNNRPLKLAIDELTRDGGTLDEAATADLFQKYIVDFDEHLTQRMSAGFERVLADMEQSAAHAESHANLFGKELAQLSIVLGGGGPASVVGEEVGKLLSRTLEMQNAIATLAERLDQSQNEIRALRQEVDQARELAVTDGLTGLVNRRGFDLALSACLTAAASGEQAPCLLIVDIDHFKTVNDQYGHIFGDKVICRVAQILKANVKGKDTAARYGGEEFAILLPETSLDGARALAETIRLTIAGSRVRRADNRQEIGQITVSIGVVGYCCGEEDSRFVERGDNALYLAKNEGRNRVCVAVPDAPDQPGKDGGPLVPAVLVAETARKAAAASTRRKNTHQD